MVYLTMHQKVYRLLTERSDELLENQKTVHGNRCSSRHTILNFFQRAYSHGFHEYGGSVDDW